MHLRSGIDKTGRALETTASLCRGVIRISNWSGADPGGSKGDLDIVLTVRAVAAATSPVRRWSPTVCRITGRSSSPRSPKSSVGYWKDH